MYKIFSAMALAGALSACGSDDSSSDSTDPVTDENAVGENITFALTVERATVKPNYLITQSDLMDNTASISTQGQGIEISDFAYFYTVNNTTFSMTNSAVTAYGEKDGEIKKINEAVVGSVLWATYGNVNDEKMIAIDSNMDKLVDHSLYTFNAETGKSEGSVSLSILEDGTLGGAWPTALVVNGDKLYVPYLKIYYSAEDQLAFTPDANTGYVAVFDYPVTEGATPVQTISSSNISNIGTHGATTGLIQTDDGDLYGYTNGEVSGGFMPSDKPSSIVRIKDGEIVFDEDYEFNIEDATDGGKIFWFSYLTDNKAIARIVERRDILVDHDQNAETAEVQLDDVLDATPWEDYYTNYGAVFADSAYRQKLVIIDLETKTITDIDGVPAHAARLVPDTEIIDGKFYASIVTNEGSAVYLIDIAAATAVKGSDIEGYTIRGFQDLYN